MVADTGTQARRATPTVELSATNVHLVYRSGNREVEALRDVTVEVPKGQFLALVGASGCGKTSLLNMFAGLLKQTRGEILVEGRKVDGPSPQVGYMFARDGLLPWRHVDKNVALGLEARGKMSRSQIRARVREMLELVGLHDFGQVYPRQLSHGMRQRAAIARTLAPAPDILLMDEPFGALDAQTKLHLQTEFLRIIEDEAHLDHKTVVFVTHDLHEALLLADRVVMMLPRPGRVALDKMIDIPRPRSENLRDIIFSPEFRELHRELFDLLQAGTHDD